MEATGVEHAELGRFRSLLISHPDGRFEGSTYAPRDIKEADGTQVSDRTQVSDGAQVSDE